MIRADGRRMYRVLDNLYNNAAKYAMPYSRVYVDGENRDGKVIFSIKNMSENPLNVSAEELMERFVRGGRLPYHGGQRSGAGDCAQPDGDAERYVPALSGRGSV